MDGAHHSSAGEEISGQRNSLRIAQTSSTDTDPGAALAEQLGNGPFALVCLFASPDADFDALVKGAQRRFGDTEIMACTTAGEIGFGGYEEGEIIAVAFPATLFAATLYEIAPLDQIKPQDEIDRLIQARLDLSARTPDMVSEFAFLMVDGLSLREEHLTATLASGLGSMPLFGGSAGDGTAFQATYLAKGDHVMQNAAMIALIRSYCPVRVFSLDHLVPTETRMVVTDADPDTRVVREINAEPAAQEYARLLGKDPNQLTAFTFAAHPVVVRLGDSHHVRAIQRVDENGDLVFFSAINAGTVLTLANHEDIAEHLVAGLGALAHATPPDHILGCDCLLRRIEAGQSQKTRAISSILKDHKVVGFSTYGEQIGALHVNQTLTGVAIYPPKDVP